MNVISMLKSSEVILEQDKIRCSKLTFTYFERMFDLILPGVYSDVLVP